MPDFTTPEFDAARRVVDGGDASLISDETEIPPARLRRVVTYIRLVDDLTVRGAVAFEDFDRRADARLEEEFEDGVNEVLARLGRADTRTRNVIVRRQKRARSSATVLTVLLIAVSVALLLVFLAGVGLAGLVAADPRAARLTLEQDVSLRVSLVLYGVFIFLIWYVFMVSAVALWGLAGPFALCLSTLETIRRVLGEKRDFPRDTSLPWDGEKRADRRRLLRQLRFSERQLTRRLLVYPGYSTMGARSAELVQRRRGDVGSAGDPDRRDSALFPNPIVTVPGLIFAGPLPATAPRRTGGVHDVIRVSLSGHGLTDAAAVA